jgi:hypothetical protein
MVGTADSGKAVSEKDYRTYLSKMQLDPALFSDELKVYKNFDAERRKGKIIVKNISTGIFYAVPKAESRKYANPTSGYELFE